MNQIKNTLDQALEIATNAQEINAKYVVNDAFNAPRWPNVMLSGMTGSGKTAIVKEWAEEKGILLVEYDLKIRTDTIYKKDQFGILHRTQADNPANVAKQLIFSTLSKYKGQESFVLLLDDYHLATKENLEAMNYTIDTHKIINPVTNEVIELDNLLFVIAIKTTTY